MNTMIEPIAGVPCEGCGGMGVEGIGDDWGNVIPTGPHADCQGTGYRFPWLWRECRKIHSAIVTGGVTSVVKNVSHEEDFCTGYVLIEGEGERLLGLWRAVPDNVPYRNFTRRQDGLVLCELFGEHLGAYEYDGYYHGTGDTPFAALASALVKALGIDDA